MTKEEITKIANKVAIIMKSTNNAKTDHDDTPEGATMDADGNVIPHEEKEELNEGKMPEGLKNYLMKKKGKKEDKKEEMKKALNKFY